MLKNITLIFILFFMCVGAFAVSEKFMTMEIFTVSNVEVKGVDNSNRRDLILLGNSLVGMNIFDANIGVMAQINDPWVQKLVASRQLPNEIQLVVYEEIPQFKYKYDKSCYTYVKSGKVLKSSCDGVNIVAKSHINRVNAERFKEILDKNEFLSNTNIILKPNMFEVRYGDETIYSPYNNDLFVKNYDIYTNVLKKRYKTIDYADLTVDERIYVKGVRSGTTK